MSVVEGGKTKNTRPDDFSGRMLKIRGATRVRRTFNKKFPDEAPGKRKSQPHSFGQLVNTK
jgi:hypothetical protein